MYRFNISLPLTDKILFEWIRERMQNNDFSPSLIFRDAMLEKKKQWDSQNLHDTISLLKRIETLKEAIGKQTHFIEKKGLQTELFDFLQLSDTPEEQFTQQIETILEDNSRVKKSKKGIENAVITE